MAHFLNKKNKRLKFQSLEPRMVFDGALDPTVELGLDSHHAFNAMLNDSPETEEILDIKEPLVTWKENPDPLIRGKNDSVFLLPSIKLGKHSSHIKEVEFSSLMKGDQLKVVYNEKYKKVDGYSELLNKIKWNYMNANDKEEFFIATLSAPINATQEAWEAVLYSIMFTHKGDNPGSNREMNVGITYQDATYEDHIVPITMKVTDDALTWKAETNTLRVTYRGVAESNIFRALTLKDPDSVLDSVVVRFRNPQDGDTFFVPDDVNQAGLSVILEDGGKTVRLTGSDVFALYEKVLKTLKFKSTGFNINVRDIDIEFYHKNNDKVTKSVSLSFTRDSLMNEIGSASNGSDGAIFVLPNVELVASSWIGSVTLTILNPSPDDTLFIKDGLSIERMPQTITNSKHEIKLTGRYRAEKYQQILRNLQCKIDYLDNPLRKIQVKLEDQYGVQEMHTMWLNVDRQIIWREKEDKVGNNDPVFLFSDINFTQKTVDSIQIEYSSGFSVEDFLRVRLADRDVLLDRYSQDGFTATRSSALGNTYTIQGKGVSSKQWESFLRSLVFNHEGDHPTASSNTRVIKVAAKDFHKVVAIYGVSVALTPDDDAMEWEAITNTLSLTSNGVAESDIFETLTLKDPDSALDSVVLRLKNGKNGDTFFVPDDVNQEGLSVTLENDGKTVRLTGSDAFALYEKVLKRLQFQSTEQDKRVREIEIEFHQKNKDVVKKSVSLSFNQGPLIKGIGSISKGSDGAVFVLPNALLVPNSWIGSVTLTILSPFSDDALFIEDGLNIDGMPETITNSKHEIKLKGRYRAEKYQEILRKVKYTNGYLADSTSTIQIKLEDEHGVQAVETISVRVEPKSVMWSEKANSIGKNDPVPLFSDVNFTQEKVDSIEILVASGFTVEDSLRIRSGDSDVWFDHYKKDDFTVKRSSLGNRYTIQGKNILPKQWESFLRSLVFNHEGDHPTASSNTRFIRLEAKMEGKTVAIYGVSVALTPDDDAMQWEERTNILRLMSKGFVKSDGVAESEIFEVAESDIFETLTLKDPDGATFEAMVIRIENPKIGEKLVLPKNLRGLHAVLEEDDQKVTLSGSQDEEVYDAVVTDLYNASKINGKLASNIKVTSRNFDMLDSVSIRITNPQRRDKLVLPENVDKGILKVTLTNNDQMITLTGYDSFAAYEKVLKGLQFKTTTQDVRARYIDIEFKKTGLEEGTKKKNVSVSFKKVGGMEEKPTTVPHDQLKEESVSVHMEQSVHWKEQANGIGDNDGVLLLRGIKISQEKIASIKISGLLQKDSLWVRSLGRDLLLDGYEKDAFTATRGSLGDTYFIRGKHGSFMPWEYFLRSLLFNHEGDNPTAVMDTRSIRVEARDFEGNIVAIHSVSVKLKPVDDPLEWKAKPNTLRVTSRGVAESNIFHSLTLDDPDTPLDSVVVRLKNGKSGDAFFVPDDVNQGELKVALEDDGKTVTFSGLNGYSAYAYALKRLQFKSTQQDQRLREIEIEFHQKNKDVVKKSVFIPSSLEPLIKGLKTIEKGSGDSVFILPDAALVSDDFIYSVTLTILSPFSDEALFIEDGLNDKIITQKTTDSKYEIILTGLDTAKKYQEILRKVKYKSGYLPDFMRTIQIKIENGDGVQAVENISVHVESKSLTWNEKEDSIGNNDAVFLFPAIKISEKSIASIEILGVLGEDGLWVRSAGRDVPLEGYSHDNFIATRSSTGTYTIQGTNATGEQWESLFHSLVFNHEGDNPTGSRKISVVPRDAEGNSLETYRVSVALMPSDDDMIFQSETNTLRVTYRGVAESNVFRAFTLKDPDSPLDSVVVRLKNGKNGDTFFVPDDMNQAGLSVTLEDDGKTVRLTGSDVFALYEKVLKTLKFKSTGFNINVRDIDIEFYHKNNDKVTKSVSLSFTRDSLMNEIGSASNGSDGAIFVLPNVELVASSWIGSVTLTILDPSPDDALFIKDGLSIEGMPQTITNSKHEIKLTGLNTAEKYQQILRNLQCKIDYLDNPLRKIQVKLEDQYGVQEMHTMWLNVDRQIIWREKEDKVGNNDPVFLFSDINFTQKTVDSIQIEYSSGFSVEDFLRVRLADRDVLLDRYSQDGFTATRSSELGNTYTIQGKGVSSKQWESFLRSLVFNHEGDHPTASSNTRVIKVAAKDFHKVVAIYGVSVALTPDDDAMEWEAITNTLRLTSNGVAESDIFETLTLKDRDSALDSVVLRLKNGKNGDTFFVPDDMNQEGLSVTLENDGKTVRLTGSDAFALYEKVLKRLQFKTTAQDVMPRYIDIEFKKRGLEEATKKKNVSVYFEKVGVMEEKNPTVSHDQLKDSAGAVVPEPLLQSDDPGSKENGSETQSDEMILKNEHSVKEETVSLRMEPRVEWKEQPDRIRNNEGVLLFRDIKNLQEKIAFIEISGVLGDDSLRVRSAGGDVSLDGYSQGGFTVKRSSLGDRYIIQGKGVSFVNWGRFLRSLVFNHEEDDPTASRNTRFIRAEVRDLQNKIVAMYGVSVALTPDDDPLEWQAKTKTLRVTREGVPESKIFDYLILDDPDTPLDSVVARLKNPQSGDLLFVFNYEEKLDIISTDNDQTLIFSGSKTLFAYQDVLRELQFKSASKNLMAREIEIKVHQKNGTVFTKSVFVTLKGEGFLEGVKPVVYKAGLEEKVSILPKAKLKPGKLRSVAISILDPFSGDLLSTNHKSAIEADGIIVDEKTTETEIRLRGVKAAQDYEKILRKIHYKTTQRNASVRTIRVIIEDQNGVKEEETFSLRVEPHVEWTEKPDSRRGNDGVLLFPGLIFSEKSIASLEIDGLLGEDRLRVRSSRGDVLLDNYKKLGFEAHMDQSKGLYMITSSNASRKSWERLLRSLVFNHEGDNPKGSRKISVVARDAEAEPVGRTYGVSVALKPVDDGIQWKAQTNRLTVTSDGVSASIFESLLLEDPDTENVTLSSMIIRLKDGQSEDSLVLVDQKGLRVTPSRNNQELKLEGVRNLSVYRDVLQGLQFKSTLENLMPRKIEFELLQEDGSILLKKEVSISGAENIEKPAGSQEIPILPNMQINSDHRISFVQITLVGALPGDTLFMQDGWEKEANGIILGEKKTNQEIRFKGLGTAQDYERLLKKIYYKDTFLSVLSKKTHPLRAITVSIKDEYGKRKKQIFFYKV